MGGKKNMSRQIVLGFKGVPTSGLRRVYLKHPQNARLKQILVLLPMKSGASVQHPARMLGVSAFSNLALVSFFETIDI